MKKRTRESKLIYALNNFSQSLHPEQNEAVKLIRENDVTLLMGKAGSGKTLTACFAALDLLIKEQCSKIYITRPTITDKSLEMGYLPGDIAEKMDPWVVPLNANLDLIIGTDEREALVDGEALHLAPLAYMRGRTFLNACIIVDEVQNMTDAQVEMILTRLGKNSKMILCGDVRQVDLPSKNATGLPFLHYASTQIEGLACFELLQNHRHPIVDKILDYYTIFHGENNRKNPPRTSRPQVSIASPRESSVPRLAEDLRAITDTNPRTTTSSFPDHH